MKIGYYRLVIAFFVLLLFLAATQTFLFVLELNAVYHAQTDVVFDASDIESNSVHTPGYANVDSLLVDYNRLFVYAPVQTEVHDRPNAPTCAYYPAVSTQNPSYAPALAAADFYGSLASVAFEAWSASARYTFLIRDCTLAKNAHCKSLKGLDFVHLRRVKFSDVHNLPASEKLALTENFKSLDIESLLLLEVGVCRAVRAVAQDAAAFAGLTLVSLFLIFYFAFKLQRLRKKIAERVAVPKSVQHGIGNPDRRL